jgi:hypothetical protein
MKTKYKKLKTVTVDELRVINENSIKANFNRTFNIDDLVDEGVLDNVPHFVYPVQRFMYHLNNDGSVAIRVYINTNEGFDSLIMDMTEEDYDNLFKMKFKVVA